MGRIRGQDEVPFRGAADLSQLLHPSYGLPARIVLALLADAPPPAGDDDGGDDGGAWLVEVTPGP
ncbi:MAG TPA: hypothetical protein VM263_01770 [Acidimicrobiales bacterium]|jgi:hypothetical protein|nr:hypothetical protein [Acidimicrobiales bacterium]